MIQLIYTSAATVPFSSKELATLLTVARTNNEALNVSGMLVYHSGSFLQILEGESDNVYTIYNKVEKDPRHEAVRLLLKKETEERSFGDWTMGFFDTTTHTKQPLDGFSDFFRSSRPFGDEDPDRAKSVLLQFRNGSWRQCVNSTD